MPGRGAIAAVRDPRDDRVRDRRVRLEEPALRLRQADGLRHADRQLQQRLRDRLPQPPRDVDRDPRPDHLVGRLAQQPLRDHPAAVADGQERRVGEVRDVGRDVHRAVAHPDDQDAPARVVAARGRSRARAAARHRSRRGRRGPATPARRCGRTRRPARRTPRRRRPIRHRSSCALRTSVAEPDPVGEAEPLDVALQPAPDRVAARVVRRPLRHRVLGELRPRPARDQVQRLVRRRRPVLQRPHAADPRAALEGRRVDPGRGQRTQRRQPGGPRSDDRDPLHAAIIALLMTPAPRCASAVPCRR